MTIVVTVTYVPAGDARRQRRRGRDHGADHLDPAGGGCPAPPGRVVLAALVIVGAALLFGDSMITPAISVLVRDARASRSRRRQWPDLVVPDHRRRSSSPVPRAAPGHGRVGRMFGPVMVVWFTVIGVIGLRGIVAHPEILEGAVARATPSGSSAGHFSVAFRCWPPSCSRSPAPRRSTRTWATRPRADHALAWLVLVFPGLHPQLPGPGRAGPGRPQRHRSPFFLLAPGWARLPHGAPAATRPSSPRRPSSPACSRWPTRPPDRLPAAAACRLHLGGDEGQIDVPWINWGLLVSVLALVLTFKSSAALAYAFGMAVTGTITITTCRSSTSSAISAAQTMVDRRARRRLPPLRRPSLLRRQPDQAGDDRRPRGPECRRASGRGPDRRRKNPRPRPGAFRSERDILNVNFVAKGRMICLGDIARVTRGPADPTQPMFRVNGKDGIGLAIAMRKGGDVLALGRNVEHAMQEIKSNLPYGVEPTLIADQPVTVDHAVADFMEALWEAIAIVLGVSLIALGVRAGAVVALSIPLVLAVVFVTMSVFGIDLQRISLGALIIALGLLVDDAMITIESMVTRLERGDEKEEAAKFAYSSTAFPRLAGTLVTVAAFVPIGFAHSAAGEYTFSIFAVVAIALIGSWGVAALFTPMLGVWVLKKPQTAHPEQPGRIMRAFRSFLALAMRARWITIGATLALFAAAVFGMRCVPQQFFPASDRPELLVDLQLPENASIYATRDASARLDKLLKDDQDVDHWSTYVGQGAVRFYLPLNVQLPNDFFAQTVVVTKGLEQRERVKAKLEKALAADFPNAVGRVYPLELGPPVGWPLQYRVSGREPDEVRKIASHVAELVGSAPGAANVNYNWMEPGRTIKIQVDQDQARLLGLSSQKLALAVNAVVSGVTATEMRSGIWLDDVPSAPPPTSARRYRQSGPFRFPCRTGKPFP